MTQRKGTIQVQTGDIFPIIKKWLYSEHDIFLRELIANATDAITKRATLGRTRNCEIPTGKIDVLVNKDEKTIVIQDNGVGMTEQEVEKYLAQLAFSGATEFIEKMKAGGEKGADIIGKFGLGFYSSFMVADKVEVNSLSMDEGAKAVKWTCAGDVDYTFEESDKAEVGTTITLHINEESTEFLDTWKLKDTLRTFCDFMPYSIGVLDQLAKPTYPLDEEGKEDKTKDPIPPSADIINTTEPLWKKNPSELKDEDYQNFFRQLFPMEQPPLFWIHLKVDHPFTLEGILYFPKFNPKKPFNENNIKLYCKQVFVSDNVKNVVPEFLSLLKGTIDSTDIPLNVSRSSLQGDPNVKKISGHIIKKVAEALKKLFKNDREKYEQIWEDIGIFVKYGSISDTKFDEIMRDKVLLKNSDNKLMTLQEYRESIPESYKEKMGDKVIYAEKDRADITLRAQLLKEGIHSLEIDDHIDPHFIQHVESKPLKEDKYQFSSVDVEFGNLLATENTNEDDIKIKELFTKVLVGEEATESKDEADKNLADPAKFDVAVEKVKNDQAFAYFKVDEQMKRFSKMAESMGNGAGFPIKKTLVINPNNPLIQNAYRLHNEGGREQLVEKICHHVEDLALIGAQGLGPEDKEGFIQRSQSLIKELTDSLNG